MVSFKLLALAALAIPALAATTPAQVVTNIKGITQKSQDLQQPASELTPANSALVAIGQGPLAKVILGFGDIVTTAGAAFVQMQGMEEVGPGAASDAIFDAFREFVKVHQALLNILIGKAGLFTTIPFVGEPVAAALRQIEEVVDTLTNSLIDILQGRGPEVEEQGDMLMDTVEKSIESFEDLESMADQSDDPMMGSSVTDSLSGPLAGLLSPDKNTPALPASPSSSSPSLPASAIAVTPAAVPPIASAPDTPKDGSPSGASLSSGDNTLEGLLKPITDLLQGVGGGATSLPAKRALAFKA